MKVDSHNLATDIFPNNQISIVLVEPKDSRNIGSVLRAIDNFGFSNLRLVAPQSFDKSIIAISACWSKDLIEQIEVFNTLEEALADREDAIGFSSDYGSNKRQHVSINNCIEEISTNLSVKLALVFGSEDQGLRNEHVQKLRTLVRIPTNSNNPSLNLAQAVTIALYELSKLNWKDENSSMYVLATWNDYQQLEVKINNLMNLSDFRNNNTSPDVTQIMNMLFRRLKADSREMAMLLGFFSRLEKSYED
jgi:tRNA/rRNA methyltransferase